MQSVQIKERPFKISGKIKIDTYRAGMVAAVEPLLRERQSLFHLQNSEPWHGYFELLVRRIEQVKAAYFIGTAVECHNLVMDSPGYGIDLIIQRLIGMNTYSLNIMFGEIGTGTATPTLADTALTTPTNRAAVGFQQNSGSTSAIFQFFFADSQLANQTYNEFGTFVDGTATLGSGQIFNHALLTPDYTKVPGQDTTAQVEFDVFNS